MSTLIRSSLVALVLFGTLAPWSASADPSGTRIDDVAQCSGSSCSDTSQVDDGGVVAGFIEITAASRSSLEGLDWLQIQMRLSGQSGWYCLRQWNASGATSEVVRSFSLNTTKWPAVGTPSCDLSGQNSVSAPPSGELTRNGSYEIRAVAQDTTALGQSARQASTLFAIKINNAPTPPSWAADAKVLRDGAGQPVVQLRFTASPEPDVVQYDIVRTGPDGQVSFPINASQPGGQGCEKSGSTYTCYDDFFPASGYGGSYSYRLMSYRSSPVGSTSCRFGGACIASTMSGPDSVAVTEPSPSPSPSVDSPTPTPRGSSTPSTGGSGSGSGGGSSSSSPRQRSTPRSSPSVQGSRTDSSEFFTGTYDEQLPYDTGSGFGSLLPGDSTGDGAEGTPTPSERTDSETVAAGPFPPGDPIVDRRIMVSLAAGLLMVLVAMHIIRLLFDR